jgi:hypothetical protein
MPFGLKQDKEKSFLLFIYKKPGGASYKMPFGLLRSKTKEVFTFLNLGENYLS